MTNALDKETLAGVTAWIEPACTIALVGSSGVGKSTLLNALAGSELAATGGIREQDQKGRHTTSYRSLTLLPAGGLLIDVPGIRELKVADIGTAFAAVFEDIETLAARCRFKNCGHESEPDCTVRAAVDNGELSERRLQNYLKLRKENLRHSIPKAEQRTKDRGFAKLVKQAKALKRQPRSSQ
jgi:ribosome biogenesis GTPase